MRFFSFLLILCISVPILSQDKEMDSLYKNLELFKEDTNLVNTYNSLSFRLNNTKVDMSLFFAEEARDLALKLKYNSGLVSSYSNIGIAHYFKGEYTIALKNHTKAAEILEKIKNIKRLSAVYNNIALIYLDLGNLNSAEEYFKKSLKLDKIRNDFYGIGDSYNNLGTIYKERQNYRKAVELFNKSLHYKELANDRLNIGSTLTNLGTVNIFLVKYDLAKEQFEKAQALLEQLNDEIGLSLLYNSIGDLKMAERNYKEAIIFYNKSLIISQKSDIQSYISYSFQALSMAFEKTKDYRQAYVYHKQYTKIRDKIYNAENAAQLAEIQTKYETEQKKKELLLSKTELEKQNGIAKFFIFGFVLLLIFIFFVLKSYKTKVLNTRIILEQKLAIEEKNRLVENQHKDIKDSIKYAERIQGAILPPTNFWNSILPNSFVLYQPKDVLSGDFYWVAETADFKFVAAADCTGHGVPGALISIINYNLLNKAVLEKQITSPGEILDAVNIWLTESLHQTAENSPVKDGMDICLISINKSTNEVLFSGANNPLFVYSDNKLHEYKGDKFPVGSFLDETTMNFKTSAIEVQKGDVLYLFSDGYADQFGGEHGKKFKLNKLRSEFQANHKKPINQQWGLFYKTFKEWKGDLEQVDDVLIIGLEI